MGYVRAHRRKDGTYVRAHYRSPRRRSASSRQVATGGFSAGAVCRVRPYVRRDGTYVRGHHRTISSSAPSVGSPAGAGAVLTVVAIVLIFIGVSKANASPMHPAAPQRIGVAVTSTGHR